MFCEHVGLFRLSSAEVNTPHCPPLRARKAREAKIEKKTNSDRRRSPRQLPSNGCDQASPSLPILRITSLNTSLSHSLPISFFPSLPRYSRSHLLHSSGTHRSHSHLSFASDQRRLDVLLTFTTLRPISALLWVYHRDFGATFSVIYGK